MSQYRSRQCLLLSLFLSFFPAPPVYAQTTCIINVNPTQVINPNSKKLLGISFDGRSSMDLDPGPNVNPIGYFDPVTGVVLPKIKDVWGRTPVTAVRYPGNLEILNWNWSYTIGPINSRIAQPLGPNGSSSQSIAFGFDEFMAMTLGKGLPSDEVQIMVNLFASVGQPNPAILAADWVEYCNAPNNGTNPRGGTDWAMLRALYGHPAPYNIKIWNIGNEPWGPSELGNSVAGANTFIGLATPIIDSMLAVDPTLHITLPFVGSSNSAWNSTLMAATGFMNRVYGFSPHAFYDEDPATANPQIIQTETSITTIAAAAKAMGKKIVLGDHANSTPANDPDKAMRWEGALATADFLVMLSQINNIELANFWIYGNVNAVWHPIRKNADGTYTFMAAAQVYERFNAVFCDQSLLTTVSNAAGGGAVSAVRATAYKSGDDANASVVAVNISPSVDNEIVPPAMAGFVLKSVKLMQAPSINSDTTNTIVVTPLNNGNYAFPHTSVLMFEYERATISQGDFWKPTNGPQGGIYRDITSNLATGNTYLVTHWNLLKGNGLGSNIFMSPDGGATWNEIDNGLSGRPVYGIAHSSVNANLVISVMNPTSPLSPTIPTKIFFSNNNGGTWMAMDSNFFAGNLPPVALQFNHAADTIFAGQKTNGISFSANNGATWTYLNSGITNKNITDIEYGYQGKLYACTDSVAGNGGKVFVKNGATWVNMSTGLPNTRMNDLYYDAASATMYVGTANFQSGTGAMYKSVNGGAWTKINGYPNVEASEITVAANGDPVVRVFKQGVWRYANNTWSAVNTNLNALRTSAITRDVSGDILVTTNAGIWKFDDATNAWSYFTNGIKNSQGRSMAFSQNGDLIVGTDNGMYKSPDGGVTWSHTGLTDTVMMSTMLYGPDGRMFAGNSDNTASHVFTSTDNGSSWKVNENGFSSLRTSDFAYNSQGKLFVGTGWQKPVHTSSDGINWNAPIWSALGFSANTVVIAVAIDAADKIFVGTESQGVLRSTNNGSSYQWVGFSGGDVTDIQISPNQDVFVAHDAFSGNGNGALYRSTDGGNSWSLNLMPAHGLTNCIFIASPDSIYVGTTKGVWVSIDSGNTWALLNSGLNPGNIVIHTLELSPDGYLYAGTAGAGIYRSANRIKTIPTVPLADFTALPTTGCAPLTVQLDNTSSGAAFTYAWTFAGGIPATSTVQNPGVQFNQPGDHLITLNATANGVTYTTSKTISVWPTTNATQQASICQGDTYSFNGQILSAPGIYTANLTSVNGCDSIVTLTLGVWPTTGATQQASICQGDTYPFNGQTLSAPGVYTANLTSVNGCDSVVTLTLTVWPTTGATQQGSICQGDTYSFNGQMLSAPGIYAANLTSVNGCDSVVILTLTVQPSPLASFSFTLNGAEVVFVNNSTNGTLYFWDFGDGITSTAFAPVHEYTTNGTYTISLTVTNGCGSALFQQPVQVIGTATSERTNQWAVLVFPNPNRGVFSVKIEGLVTGEAEFSLFGVDGRLIKRDRQTIQESQWLDFSNTPAGAYLLEIRLENGRRFWAPVVIGRD